MITRTENNFIKGSQQDIKDFLVISEDCRGYIDSIIERVRELGLTIDEQCKFDVFASDISFENVTFYLPTGERIVLRKNYIDFQGGKWYYDLKYTQERSSNLQLGYDEKIENIGHNNEIEKIIDIEDGKELTQYQKQESIKKIVFDTEHGKYDYKYIGLDCYRKYDIAVGEGEPLVYTNLDGTPLTQPELIATTFGSFDMAYASFYEKFNKIRNLIDERIKEISKIKKTKRK